MTGAPSHSKSTSRAPLASFAPSRGRLRCNVGTIRCAPTSAARVDVQATTMATAMAGPFDEPSPTPRLATLRALPCPAMSAVALRRRFTVRERGSGRGLTAHESVVAMRHRCQFASWSTPSFLQPRRTLRSPCVHPHHRARSLLGAFWRSACATLHKVVLAGARYASAYLSTAAPVDSRTRVERIGQSAHEAPRGASFPATSLPPPVRTIPHRAGQRRLLVLYCIWDEVRTGPTTIRPRQHGCLHRPTYHTLLAPSGHQSANRTTFGGRARLQLAPVEEIPQGTDSMPAACHSVSLGMTRRPSRRSTGGEGAASPPFASRRKAARVRSASSTRCRQGISDDARIASCSELHRPAVDVGRRTSIGRRNPSGRGPRPNAEVSGACDCPRPIQWAIAASIADFTRPASSN